MTFLLLQGFIESSLSNEESLPESESEWAEWLSSSGTADEQDTVCEYREESFQLTPKGTRFTEPMYEGLLQAQRALLKEFKRRTSGAPLRALLRYVYTNYREDTVMSKIRDEVLGSNRY
ncbi:hypothetical protein LCGC14_1963520 [marine sediment metagenome]|uniref:Uncharacterized protein n=1 Tax=marine sediment metagenome TaxID=412755 RepID=A0A0F9FE79_9ZZZZ